MTKDLTERKRCQVLRQKRRLAREELRQKKRENRLNYQAARYKVGRVSATSKVLTCIVLMVYICTIAIGIHLMYKFEAASQIYALFASVTVPAGTTIFAFIRKNQAENTAGGITHDANIDNFEGGEG